MLLATRFPRPDEPARMRANLAGTIPNRVHRQRRASPETRALPGSLESRESEPRPGRRHRARRRPLAREARTRTSRKSRTAAPSLEQPLARRPLSTRNAPPRARNDARRNAERQPLRHGTSRTPTAGSSSNATAAAAPTSPPTRTVATRPHSSSSITSSPAPWAAVAELRESPRSLPRAQSPLGRTGIRSRRISNAPCTFASDASESTASRRTTRPRRTMGPRQSRCRPICRRRNTRSYGPTARSTRTKGRSRTEATGIPSRAGSESGLRRRATAMRRAIAKHRSATARSAVGSNQGGVGGRSYRDSPHLHPNRMRPWPSSPARHLREVALRQSAVTRNRAVVAVLAALALLGLGVLSFRLFAPLASSRKEDALSRSAASSSRRPDRTTELEKSLGDAPGATACGGGTCGRRRFHRGPRHRRRDGPRRGERQLDVSEQRQRVQRRCDERRQLRARRTRARRLRALRHRRARLRAVRTRRAHAARRARYAPARRHLLTRARSGSWKAK